MTDLFEALFKFFNEPLTLRRVFILSLIVGAAFGGIVFYEAYTANFRLGRLQKSADLLARLQELETSGTNGTPETQRARKLLRELTLATIETTPAKLDLVPARLTLSLDSLWKFLAGSALWLVFSLSQIEKWKHPAGRREILGHVTLAVIAGLVATLLPPFWWPWFHLLIYPYLFIATLVAVSLPFVVLLSAVSRAKQKANSINCVNNLKSLGLSARIWATDHGGNLPDSSESLKHNLPGQRMRCCPLNDSEEYPLLSPGATEADPTVVYSRCPHHSLVLLTDGSVQRLGKNRLVQEGKIWRIKEEQAERASD